LQINIKTIHLAFKIMNKKVYYFLSLLLISYLPCFSLSYNISFTGSGANNSVDSVVVTNITKGTSLTVPSGYSLNLYDQSTSVDEQSLKDNRLVLFPLSNGNYELSFASKNTGKVQISIFNLDGKVVINHLENVEMQEYKFNLSLPKGTFLVKINGTGYTYTTKISNQIAGADKAAITLPGSYSSNSMTMQKTKYGVPTVKSMLYSTGDRIQYKGASGKNSTIVMDVPTSDKTINFNFVVCEDMDGNNYTSVTIGNQIWMVENLRTTRLNDGSSLYRMNDGNTWIYSVYTTIPSFMWNGYTSSEQKMYGCYYNWHAVNTGKLAPAGWRVPTSTDWITLQNSLGGPLLAGGKMKATGSNQWLNPNTGATNESGFTALPGGYISKSTGGTPTKYQNAVWWSSTGTESAYGRFILNYNNSEGDYFGYETGNFGFSVRCIKE